MEHNIKPILKREPDYIVLHFRTNNVTNLTARDIIDKLLQLKSKILDSRKSCKVIISQPTLRFDNGKAALTNHHLWNLLEALSADIAKNRNSSKHLGGKALHLSLHGTARLALNLKATIRKSWSKFGNLGNPGYQSNVTSVSSDHNNFQNLNHCNKNTPQKSTFSFQETNNKSYENNNRSNATVTLQNLRLENPNRIMMRHV